MQTDTVHSSRIDDQSRGLLMAVVALRFALLAWAGVVVAIDIRGVTRIRGSVAIGLLVALTIWSALYGWLLLRRPHVVTRAITSVVDVALASVVAAADMWVYSGSHPQSFASAWPLCAAIVAGVVHGKRVGAAAGLLIGASGAIGIHRFADGGLDQRWLGAAGTIVLLTVSGALAGMVTDLLRSAELATSRARAREEVARTLHDGVMQTLAAVQRRSTDSELVSLAREQELELRRFIEVPGGSQRGSGDVAAALRDVVTAAERRTGVHCELVVIDSPSAVAVEVIEGLSGVVTEAITNASKHGSAERVLVCIDHFEGRLSCVINDDGTGFEPRTTAEGTGIARSMRGRVEELSGSLTIESSPGSGCEITVTVPV